MIPRIYQTKTDNAGNFVFNRAKIVRTLQAAAGQPIEIVIRPYDPKRSIDMNAYYWAVVVKTIADHFFYNASREVHEMLKDVYKEMLDPVYEKKELTGLKKILNMIIRPRLTPSGYTTKTLSRTRFMRYCKAIQVDFAEQGCSIPDPNEVEI